MIADLAAARESRRRPAIARLAGCRASPLVLGDDLVVLAPHPDDETLGCGGTIYKARAAGAQVTILFLTDGAASHIDFIDPGELRSLRRTEAIAAARTLGVDEGSLRFLDHPDGQLADSEELANRQVNALIAELSPGAVLAPCAWDMSPDHLAAARVAAAAAAAATIPVHGYPIWFWHRWPWTPTRFASRSRTLASAALNSWRLLRQFRTEVYVGDVLDVKRRALSEHRTQVEHRNGDSSWPVLGEIADGRFLELLLTDRELFATTWP